MVSPIFFGCVPSVMDFLHRNEAWYNPFWGNEDHFQQTDVIDKKYQDEPYTFRPEKISHFFNDFPNIKCIENTSEVCSFLCSERGFEILPKHLQPNNSPSLITRMKSAFYNPAIFLSGFTTWDSAFNVESALLSYHTEKMHPFLPLFPWLVRHLSRFLAFTFPSIFGVMCLRSLLIFSGVLLNTLAFPLTTLLLYFATLRVLQKEHLAYMAALLFSINPASIFFTVIYTENTFSLCIFATVLLLTFPRSLLDLEFRSDESTLRQCWKIIPNMLLYLTTRILATILLVTSSFIRSNGIVAFGFLLFDPARIAIKLLLKTISFFFPSKLLRYVTNGDKYKIPTTYVGKILFFLSILSSFLLCSVQLFFSQVGLASYQTYAASIHCNVWNTRIQQIDPTSNLTYHDLFLKENKEFLERINQKYPQPYKSKPSSYCKYYHPIITPIPSTFSLVTYPTLYVLQNIFDILYSFAPNDLQSVSPYQSQLFPLITTVNYNQSITQLSIANFSTLLNSGNNDESRLYLHSYNGIPQVYTYLQTVHWSIGAFSYYRFENIPKIIIGLPMVFLVGYLTYLFFQVKILPLFSALNSLSVLKSQTIFTRIIIGVYYFLGTSSTKTTYIVSRKGGTDRNTSEIIDSTFEQNAIDVLCHDDAVVYICYIAFLLVFALVFMHVVVIVRFLACVPTTFWFLSIIVNSKEGDVNRPLKELYGRSKYSKFVFLWCLIYVFYGSFAFSVHL